MTLIIILLVLLGITLGMSVLASRRDTSWAADPVFWKKILNAIKHGLGWFWREFIKYPLHLQTHPFAGFDEFKRDKRARMSVAIGYIALMCVAQVARYQFTGFAVKAYDINKLNLFLEIAYVVAPVLVITVSNWALTTLFDGKGSMREIFMLIGYSLMPLFWCRSFAMIISHFITQDQIAIYTLLNGIGIFLMCYMLFTGMLVIHEYGVLKCLGSILGTFVAVLVVCFAGMLVFDLVQKMYGFVYTIYREITLRYT